MILVRPFTEADDVAGFHAAKGILTSEGGKASPRRAGRARHGPPGGGRGVGARDRPQAEGHHRRRHEDLRGRPDRDRRHQGLRHARGRPARRPRGQRVLRARAQVGGRDPPPRRARQRRHAGGREEGARAGRRGHRPVPDRAHVHGRGPPAQDAGDDHGRRRGGPARGAGRAAALPAGGLRGPVRGDEGAAGDDPAARPAAARVPQEPAGPAGAGGAGADRVHRRPRAAREDARARGGDPRGEPDARHARLPAGDPLPRDLRDAGPRDHARGRGHGLQAAPGDHDPAHRLRARAGDPARARGPHRRRARPARAARTTRSGP